MRRRLRLGRARTRTTAPLLAIGFVVLAAGVACEKADAYVYSARRYDSARVCLEPYHPVEVVEGPGAAATCPETCIGVGDDVFLTTMCPPLPTIATELPADNEACVAARNASRTTCDEAAELDAAADGDSSTPPEDDAGGGPSRDLDATSPDSGDGA
jgi:hypothetical protein